jgi:hypothetical protein
MREELSYLVVELPFLALTLAGLVLLGQAAWSDGVYLF